MQADLASGSTAPAAVPATGLSWRQRLELSLHTPHRDDVARFLTGTVSPRWRWSPRRCGDAA